MSHQPPHTVNFNSTSAHPPVDSSTSSDPQHETLQTHQHPDASSQGRLAASHPSRTAQFARLQTLLKRSLRQFPDFPSKGILFEDILPIFRDPSLHDALINALELHISSQFPPSTSQPSSSSSLPPARPPPSNKQTTTSVDVIVGLEARGFLFGPSLALRLGAGFVPVRKQGKLPGPTETATFEKEYGQDYFQIQADAITPGQKVLVADDIIATGGSAAAAGSLVKKLGGDLLGYVFILELDFLRGREKLGGAPVHTLLASQYKE